MAWRLIASDIAFRPAKSPDDGLSAPALGPFLRPRHRKWETAPDAPSRADSAR
jgi:hypothetical protein